MVKQSILDFRVLISPGLHNSGPEHWQTRWQQLYPSFERVQQARWDEPALPEWSDAVQRCLRRSAAPTLIVAHSFGCLAAVHAAAASANVHGLLLVAPADPEKFGIAAPLRDVILPCRSIMVGSTNDPWMGIGNAVHWANCWGSEFVNGGSLGHINAESGLGDWLHGLAQLQRLAYLSGQPVHADNAALRR